MNYKNNLKIVSIVLAALFLVYSFTTYPAFSSTNQNIQPNLIGVVKSISNGKITVYIATQNQNMTGRFTSRRISISSKTQVINVTSKTSITTRTFQNRQLEERNIKISDIKVNNILFIWFSDSKKTNVSKISVQGIYDPYQTPEQIGIVKKVESNKITFIIAELGRHQGAPSSNPSNNQSITKDNNFQQRIAGQQPQNLPMNRIINIKPSTQTKTITISKSTEIYTRSFENGQMKENKLTIKDIKAQNIIYIWFSDSKKTTAKRIIIMGTYNQNTK